MRVAQIIPQSDQRQGEGRAAHDEADPPNDDGMSPALEEESQPDQQYPAEKPEQGQRVASVSLVIDRDCYDDERLEHEGKDEKQRVDTIQISARYLLRRLYRALLPPARAQTHQACQQRCRKTDHKIQLQ